MKERIKYILAVIIALALFIPLLQFKLELFEVKPLEGDISISQKPEFNKENYWELRYQEDYNKYVNDNFGFRSWFVRMINQFRFSFFNTTKAPGVVIGKEGELFIESYINDYIGRNYIGKAKINETVSKIKTLQDSLRSRNIDLIVVFAPGKASYYPEKIPDYYMKRKKDSSNYSVYADLFKTQEVNFIDLNKWFVDNRTTFKHKVYPKSGTHWNHYGMCLGLDTLIKYIEAKRNIDLPGFDYSLVNYNTGLKGNDYDIGVLMNLLFPIEKDPNPYPVYKFRNFKGQAKPDVLVVGDSYWWCQVGDDLPIHFFREDEYWFYNKDKLIRNEKRGLVKDINLSAALTQRNVIVLMATEATFYMFPYGFVDNAYKLYCEDHSERMNAIMNDIKKNSEWYNGIIKKAEENKVSIEHQLRMDAEYILSDEILKPIESMETIADRIKNDAEWMKEIRKKAIENNITEEEQVRRDAEWLYKQNKK
jgi:hypothetical protein